MALDLSAPQPDRIFEETFTDQDGSGKWRLLYSVGVTDRGTIAIRSLKIEPLFRVDSNLSDSAFMAAMSKAVRATLLYRVPGAGITTRFLRSIHLDAARKSIEAEILSQAQSRLVKPPRKVEPRRRGPGRPRELGMSFYRGVAKRWLALLKERNPRPLQTLADEYGRPYSNMAGVIRRCRAQGLIPPARVR